MDRKAIQQRSRFINAFFATAEELHIEIAPDAKQRMAGGLAGMKHWWLNTNEFYQIRNAERLALNLKRLDEESLADCNKTQGVKT